MTTGHVYTPTKTKDYEYLVQQSFRIKYPNVKQISNRVFVEIVAYMKIPKSTSKKQREEIEKQGLKPLRHVKKKYAEGRFTLKYNGEDDPWGFNRTYQENKRAQEKRVKESKEQLEKLMNE